MISGLFIFSLAILNEIPDYYQDRLVGKKNIVVRLGKEAAVRVLGLSWILGFFILGLGIWFDKIPYFSSISFLALPLALISVKIAKENLEKVESFISAIRISALTYLITIFCLGVTIVIASP